MPLIHLYALKSDLLNIMDLVEKQLDIKYVSTNLFLSGQESIYYSISELPKLSRVYALEKGVMKDEYLIVEKNETITPGFISGIGKYTFNQLLNVNSVMFQPGGLLKDGLIVSGSVTTCTASDSAISKKIFNTIQKHVKKHFKKVGAYWVGGEAYAVLEQGGRLAPDEQCPPNLDLRI